jgi:hypothetical protein
MGVQALFPLTHWRSCTLNGCSGGVQYSLIGIHVCTHKHSGGVQYSLTGIQVHSQAFRACSVLTQMRSLWSHHGESRSIMTQWRSCTLIGCSHLLSGSHVHSMGVQGLFPLTHWRSHALTSIQEVFNTHSNVFSRFKHVKAQ